MEVSVSPDRSALGEERLNALQVLYDEVCKAHGAITDFRGKLLALVPTLSAAAFTLFIGTRNAFDQRLLLPVGAFGVAVALGLFCYELNGMLVCHELRARGAKLEQAMQQPASKAAQEMRGHFLELPEKNAMAGSFSLLREYWPVSVPTASFLVYGSVILGWLVVAAFGVAGFF
jgi:hypothetical protein